MTYIIYCTHCSRLFNLDKKENATVIKILSNFSSILHVFFTIKNIVINNLKLKKREQKKKLKANSSEYCANFELH